MRQEIERDFHLYSFFANTDIEGAERFLLQALECWQTKDLNNEENKIISARLRQLRLHVGARETCKVETGMAAIPEKIIKWKI